MSDSKKYYYLKLKDNFFDSDSMIVLESMPDGYMYSNILLKLYLRSLKNEGRLMFNERIPYNSTVLAQVVRHSVGVVEKALQVFVDLGLIEILDNGAIYMMEIQNFIGHSSSEADRVREYRNKVSNEKSVQMLQQTYDKSTPKIEIEIEKEIKIEKEKKKKYLDSIELSDTEYEKLKEKFGTTENLNKGLEILSNYILSKGAKYKSHYHVMIGWVYERVMNDVSKNGFNRHNEKNRSDEKPNFTFRQKTYL